jgi:hypothetical protein
MIKNARITSSRPDQARLNRRGDVVAIDIW